MKNVTQILCVFFCAAALLAQTEWTHVVDHPVLAHGEAGTWDSGSVFQPVIIKEGDTLKMWYTGLDGAIMGGTRGIGFAWSLDGVTWNRHPQNPITTLKGHAGPVLKEDGLYKMWYNSGTSIFYATSRNGIDWSEAKTTNLGLGETGDWDDSIPVFGPNYVTKSEGTYLLWYTGSHGQFPVTTIQFGLATSQDGLTWSKYDDPSTVEAPLAHSDPVFTVGRNGSWDGMHLKGLTICPADHGYEMWYSGLGALGPRQWIGYGMSNDGINWIKCPGNPVLSSLPSWGQWGYLPGSVLKYDNRYHMWYASFDENGDHPQIGYATSEVIDHDLAAVFSPKHLMTVPMFSDGARPAVTIKNNGQFNEKNIIVSCEIDSAGTIIYSDSQIIESIAGENFASEEKEISFKEWTSSEPYQYTVSYFTSLAEDKCMQNDTLRTTLHVSNLIDDFEAGLREWSIDTCWSITGKAHSGTGALVSSDGGVYPNNIDAAATCLYSFDISSVQLNEPCLFFSTIYSLLPNDSGFVQVSPDGGQTWEQLGAPVSGQHLAPWRVEKHSLRAYRDRGVTDLKIRFRLLTDSADGSIGWLIDDVTLDEGTAVALDQQAMKPQRCNLSPNYPNPFNPVTTIEFFMPKREFVTLEIFNARGQNVEVLVEETLGEGRHSYTWNAWDQSSGIYIARLTSANQVLTTKMLLVK